MHAKLIDFSPHVHSFAKAALELGLKYCSLDSGTANVVDTLESMLSSRSLSVTEAIVEANSDI